MNSHWFDVCCQWRYIPWIFIQGQVVSHGPIKCQIPSEYSHMVSVILCLSVVNHFTLNNIQDGGGRGTDVCFWAYVSVWARENHSGPPRHWLFPHKLRWLTTTMFHLWKKEIIYVTCLTRWEKKRGTKLESRKGHHAQSILTQHSIISPSNSIHVLMLQTALKAPS